MTIEEIRKMTVEDLTSKVYELKNELLSLRLTGQLDNSNKITLTRKEFARVLTVVNERKKKVKNLNK